MSSPLSIVFAGTPEFGLPCLEAIATSEHKIIAVYTQPDRKAGRGQQLQPSAVKSWALNAGIKVYQPESFKNPEAQMELESLNPDLMVVIAYGLILPQKVLEIPTLGCINVHASLLPRWRGASPIQHALLHSDKESGITIMQMDKGMDTGACILQSSYQISASETASSLHDCLAKLAVKPLLSTLNQLASTGLLNKSPQNNDRATYAPKITKEDAAINWHKSAKSIEAQIRAFNPWPITFTHANNNLIRIHQGELCELQAKSSPGTILAINKIGIDVSTGDGVLRIKSLQLPGGRVLRVADYLNSQRELLHVGLCLK